MGVATQTHCKRGHLLGGENVRRRHGRRYCVTCQRLKQREWTQRQREGEMPVFLPAAPFGRWLHTNLPPEITLDEWERRLGVSKNGLGQHISGRNKRVHIDFADRVLCAAGGHLRDVWPHLYPDQED